jgi:hypothetical protein
MKLFSVPLLIILIAVFSVSCGYSSPGNTPAQAGITPAIMQLVPNNATHGAAAFTLTVNGSNFNSDATVVWNGSNLTTTFVTANQVTGAVPASAIANAGSVSVSVTNPGTSGGIYGGGTLPETSNTMTFTIN